MAKNTVVFGIYPSQQDAAYAVERLRGAGFRNTDVAILVSQNTGNKDLGLDKATKAPEGAVTGAGSGALLGGALGWLAGLGSLAIPGLGPFLAAGPLLSLLAGIGAGGAVGGVAASSAPGFPKSLVVCGEIWSWRVKYARCWRPVVNITPLTWASAPAPGARLPGSPWRRVSPGRRRSIAGGRRDRPEPVPD